MKSYSAVVRALVIGMLVGLANAVHAQQPYPSKPIRIIVPYAAGGTSFLLTQLIGNKLQDSMGQPVVMDVRPGGNSVIGTEAMTRSAPDGYTLLMVSNSHVVSPSLLKNLPYDAIKDFAPVATLVTSEYVFVASPQFPANNLQELIALCKAKPGVYNFASASTGTPSHLANELFNIRTGIKVQHVPYKGSGPAINGTIAGEVQMNFNPPILLLQFIKAGKLKALAVTGNKRLPSLPQVPTFTEAGLADFDVSSWYGVLAPAGTPKAIIETLSAEFSKALRLPDIKEKLESLGTEPFITTPDRLGALMKADLEKYAHVIKTANIKLED